MKKLTIPSNVTRAFYKGVFKIKKHSPEILVTTGVVAGVVSAVMACKATTKANTIIEEAKEKIDAIHEVKNNPVYAGQYTEEDSKKDLAIVYAQTGLKFGKLYGPSVVLGAAAIGCIFTGHNIMRKRNIALAAAYTAEHLGFKEYRGRVIDRFGKELDRELKYNIKAKEIEETVVNEDGTESTIKKTVEVAELGKYSLYARFYDDGCVGWTKNPEDNLYFLKCQENYANEKLQSRGYLFLNEVYEMLGIPISQAGCSVGWIYDEKNPIGDNVVDFGLCDVSKEGVRNFVNGHERVILLDFNVDGDIASLLA